MKGRRLAIALATAGALVVCGTAFAYRTRIREEWLIRSLSWKGSGIADAAKELGEMQSPRAAPHLVDCFRLVTPMMIWENQRHPDESLAPCLVMALVQLDPTSLPAVRDGLRSSDPSVVLGSFVVLDKMGKAASADIAEVRQRLKTQILAIQFIAEGIIGSSMAEQLRKNPLSAGWVGQ
jgi:hypothetical protein